MGLDSLEHAYWSKLNGMERDAPLGPLWLPAISQMKVIRSWKWTMGAMMRNGDQQHVVTASNNDHDDFMAVKKAGLSRKSKVFCSGYDRIYSFSSS